MMGSEFVVGDRVEQVADHYISDTEWGPGHHTFNESPRGIGSTGIVLRVDRYAVRVAWDTTGHTSVIAKKSVRRYDPDADQAAEEAAIASILGGSASHAPQAPQEPERGMTMNKEYRAALRDLMERQGKAVSADASVYGWQDHDATMHTLQISDETREKHGYTEQDFPGCRWVVPEGAELVEVEWSEFTDTDADNADVVGIEVSLAHCACGKYQDVTLRYRGSLRETLDELFGTKFPLIL